MTNHQATSPEDVIWQGHPSHWTNLGVYLLCILFCWLIVPAIYGLYRVFELRSRRYQLTSERLRLEEGVFSHQQEFVELYRIKDLSVIQPFLLRMFGLGNVVLETSDRTTPRVTLFAIPASKVAGLIRNQVELLRQSRNVREIDVD